MTSTRLGTIASLFVLALVPISAFAFPACTVTNGANSDAGTAPGDDTGTQDTTPSGDDTGTQPETTGETGAPTLDSACADQAAAFCARMDGCANWTVQSVWGTKAKCTERMKLLCLARAAAPKTGVTIANLETCATALATLACPDLERDMLPDACRPAGTVDPGGPCGDDAQCSANYFCHRTGTASCGTCTKLEVGGPCAENGRCPDSTVCSGGECKVYDPMGCSVGGTCLADQSCVGNKCVENLTNVGDACGPGNGMDCSNWRGLVCDEKGGTNKCIQLSLAGPGENCSEMVTGASYPIGCNGGGSCDVTDTPPVCFAPLADGAACGTNAALCLAPAHCDATTSKCVITDYTKCN